jgi:phosphodiesterase/alkaline phosphatase D-like protein
MKTNRRNFLRKTAAGAAGVTITSSALAATARSYTKIIGANDRINVQLSALADDWVLTWIRLAEKKVMWS